MISNGNPYRKAELKVVDLVDEDNNRNTSFVFRSFSPSSG